MSILTPDITTDEYTHRPARLDDLPGVHKLLQAIVATEPHSYAPTLEDVQRDFADPWCDPETSTWVAVAPGDEVLAYGRVMGNPEPEHEARAYLDDNIHPAYARGAVAESLFDWLVSRGAERVRAIRAAWPPATGHPPVLQLACVDTNRDRIAQYEQRGFRPVRYFFRMRRDLRQPIPDRPLPAGLSMRAYHSELDERIRQAFNESFSDHWNHEHFSPEDWQLFFVQRSTFRPDLSFAVLDGDEVAAFSMNRFDPAEAERSGYRAGWIGTLGTRRAWRKQGLAAALLVQSMRAFLAAGLEYAVLGVDAENPTRALGVYERLGFAPYLMTIVFHKVVHDQSGDL